ncbi:MAG TPA: hypothetical protein VGH99_16880 [Pseudonocardia sp.]|jgi:hypothetical protein
MSITHATDSRDTRVDVVDELLTRLQGLIAHHHALPSSERAARSARDAERITGEVARHLSTARARLAVARGPRGG